MAKQPSVVYLSWIPYGIDLLKEFIYSYQQNPAGIDHTITFIFNGVENDSDYLPFLHFAEQQLDQRVNFLVMESGQDIDAYFFAAKQLQNDHILFFNSYSKILTIDWLKKYADAFSDTATGIVGATASYQSHYSNIFQQYPLKLEIGKSISYNYSKYKLFIKAILYWRFLFKPFPNRHIRTNAFMIQRKLFLSIKYKPLTSKFRAYIFESGRNGLTAQVEEAGYQALVMDKYGSCYNLNNAHLSRTFWIDEQQNLLIADNQTEIYMNADKKEKNKMSKLAWGKYV